MGFGLSGGRGAGEHGASVAPPGSCGPGVAEAGRLSQSGRDRHYVVAEPLIEFSGKAPSDVEHAAVLAALGLDSI